jgi:hypothetical protein
LFCKFFHKHEKEKNSIGCSFFGGGKNHPKLKKKLEFFWVTFPLGFSRERGGGGGEFLKPTFQLFGHVLKTCCHLMLNLS